MLSDNNNNKTSVPRINNTTINNKNINNNNNFNLNLNHCQILNKPIILKNKPSADVAARID